jgi:plastocyanin
MTEVRVRILLDSESRRPMADPDECRVRQGDQVLFEGEDGAAFEIAFKDQSPARPGSPKKLPSHAEHGMQRARVAVANAPGTYRYGIRMGGFEVDPAIIIY